MIDPWEDDQYCWEASLMDERDAYGDDEFFNLPDFESENEFKEFLGVSSPQNVSSDFVQRHELIKFVQKSVSSKINENPSKTESVYWLYAEDKKRNHPKPTDRSGKWLVFCDPEEIDDVWKRVKKSLKAGNLGKTAKCSTKKGFKGEKYVICVYTHDWQDEDSVQMIRQGLREIGITQPIPYKTDADTLAGKYAKNGDKGIAKYYE